MLKHMHTRTHSCTHARTHARTLFYLQDTVCLISSVRRALASKLRGPGFKSRPGTVGGTLTIIM